MIDFTEIQDSDKWELFCREFLTQSGFIIVREPSKGQDTATGGYDLIVEEEHRATRLRWGVSCKHYAPCQKHVSKNDEHTLSEIANDNYAGLIAFYSTGITSTLESSFNKININTPKQVILYDSDRIESELKREDNSFEKIFKSYFPESYRDWVNLGINKIHNIEIKWHKLQKNDFVEKIDFDCIKKYYNGAPARWSLIKEYTFKRDILQGVATCIQKNNIILITGAGGEGKSTLLMQLGIMLYEEKHDVFFIDEQDNNICEIFKSIKNNPTVLIIDNVSNFEQIYGFLQLANLHTKVKVILSSRTNEWNAFVKYLPN